MAIPPVFSKPSLITGRVENTLKSLLHQSKHISEHFLLVSASHDGLLRVRPPFVHQGRVDVTTITISREVVLQRGDLTQAELLETVRVDALA